MWDGPPKPPTGGKGVGDASKGREWVDFGMELASLGLSEEEEAALSVRGRDAPCPT